MKIFFLFEKIIETSKMAPLVTSLKKYRIFVCNGYNVFTIEIALGYDPGSMKTRVQLRNFVIGCVTGQ